MKLERRAFAGWRLVRFDMKIMSEEQKSRRWRPLLIVAGVGVVIIGVALAVLLAVAIPAHRQKLVARNETAALQTLRAIAIAQDAQLANTGRYATLEQLAGAGLLNAQFAGDPPVASGYVFALRLVPPDAGDVTEPPAYTVNADPVDKATTGERHFYLDSRITGIRFNNDRAANAADRPWR